MTVIDNQEKSESFRTLNYNVICIILKIKLRGADSARTNPVPGVFSREYGSINLQNISSEL